jgi:hypothetical protein
MPVLLSCVISFYTIGYDAHRTLIRLLPVLCETRRRGIPDLHGESVRFNQGITAVNRGHLPRRQRMVILRQTLD